jgi:hypothetical protein
LNAILHDACLTREASKIGIFKANSQEPVFLNVLAFYSALLMNLLTQLFVRPPDRHERRAAGMTCDLVPVVPAAERP